MIRALILVPVALLLGMDWMSPDWWLDNFGDAFFWISLAIIFVECGLFFPFLPGDTLLFAMGLFIANERIDVIPGHHNIDLLFALAMFVAAGVGGNIAGYEIGRAIGPPLYLRDGRILKRKYFDKTTAFFDKHGNKALVIGRFVPFVRTYITVVAGVTRMDRRRFFTWSLVGALFWVVSITLIGAILGRAFPKLGENIDLAIILILAASVIPIAWEWWHKRRRKAGKASAALEDLPREHDAPHDPRVVE